MNQVQELQVKHLKQLATDIGRFRVYRVATLTLLLLTCAWSVWAMMLHADSVVFPDSFKIEGLVLVAFLFLSIFLLSENFDNPKKSPSVLQDLLTEHKRVSTLFYLLDPMVKKAFQHDPAEIKDAMVDELMSQLHRSEQARADIHNYFLKDSSEEVKNMVRARSRENMLQTLAAIQRVSGRSKEGKHVHSQDIVRLTEDMAKDEAILSLIPDGFPDSQGPIPAGTWTKPIQVTEANN